MIARIVLAALLAAALLPTRAYADPVSASEPVERLSCGDVFDGEAVSAAYAQRIVGFAFPPGASETARLAKWTQGWRLLVRAEAPPQDFVLNAVKAFRAALPRREGFSPVAQFDWNDRARIKDGDLVIYLTWRRGVAREMTENRYRDLIAEVTASASIKPIIGAPHDLRFAGIVRSSGGDVRRALVVADLNYLHLGGQPSLFQFLTTAISPNPGNAFNLGLPASTPEEKLIYEKTWRSSVDYDLGWTREFQIYLRLLTDEAVTPGMDAMQFSDVVGRLLNAPELKGSLMKLYGC